MSVIFTTITNDFIALCADRQATNMKTGEVSKDVETKIEKWSPTIAVGSCGNLTLGQIILEAVKGYVDEQGLGNFTLEELADCFAQAYYAAEEEFDDIPQGAVAKFVLAGKLSTGNLGAIQVLDGNGVADAETYEATSRPITLIFEPDDLSGDECNRLLAKAMLNTRNKKTNGKDLIEAFHRKAVRYVSECSKYVGPKSDYIVIDKV